MPEVGKTSDFWMRCPHCDHQFNAVECLKDHLQNSHPPRKEWACNKCSYTSDRQYDIARHNSRVHVERQSLGHESRDESSSEMTKPIRTAEKRKITPVPGDAEKEKGHLKVRPMTSKSPSTHSRPAPSTAADFTGPTRSVIMDAKKEVAQKADITGPTARSMIADAKEVVAQKGLKPNQSKERKGGYSRVTDTVVFPDGRVYKSETEKWGE